jgi:hypothetical protein
VHPLSLPQDTRSARTENHTSVLQRPLLARSGRPGSPVWRSGARALRARSGRRPHRVDVVRAVGIPRCGAFQRAASATTA